MVSIESSGLTHIGPVREENQDAIHLPNGDAPGGRGRLFAVADGMGGYSHGELASRLALDALVKIYYNESRHPALKALRLGVEASNLGVYQAARRLGNGIMGTTLTTAAVVGDWLYLAHVGDSRAYLIRDGQASCLTKDHTAVGELVRMKVLSPDRVRTHARRSILTRGIGLSLFVQPDLTQLKLQDRDWIILCSDGVWSVVEDDEFAHLAQMTSSAHELTQRLIGLALERETDDNVSSIVVYLPRVSPLPGTNGNGQDGRFPRLLRHLLSRATHL